MAPVRQPVGRTGGEGVRWRKNPCEAEAYFRNPWVKAQLQRQVEATLAEIRQAADWEVWARAKNPVELIHRGTQVLWIVDQAAIACRLPADLPELRIIAGAARALAEIAERPVLVEANRASIQSGMAAADRLWPQLSVWALAEAEMRYHETVVTRGMCLSDFRYFANLKTKEALPPIATA